MGDREVVRESVAKGLHINLAHTFLQARKGLDYHKIKSLYNSEVLNNIINKTITS